MPEYVIGPYVGALLAGLWKHWDTNTRIQLGKLERHPAIAETPKINIEA